MPVAPSSSTGLLDRVVLFVLVGFEAGQGVAVRAAEGHYDPVDPILESGAHRGDPRARGGRHAEFGHVAAQNFELAVGDIEPGPVAG